MADNFISQQEERILQGRRQLDEVGELFRKHVSRRQPKFDEQGERIERNPNKIKMQPVTLPDGKIGMKELLVVMLRQINRWDVMSVAMASLGISIMGMFIPYVTMQFYDEMIPSGEDNLLLPLAALLISATLGSTMFETTKSLVLLRMRDKMSASLQSSLMDRMYRMPPRFFQTYTAGKLGNMLMTTCDVMQQLMYKMLGGGLTIIFAAVYFYQIYNYAPKLLPMSVLSCFIQTLLMIVFLFFSRREETEVRRATAEESGLLYSLLQGIQKIKTTGAEERAFNRWAHIFVKTLSENARTHPVIVYFHAMMGLVSMGTLVLTYYLTMKYHIGLSSYAAYLSSFGLVTAAVTTFSTMLPELANIQPAMEQCKPLMEAEPERHETREKVEFLTGKIEIADLSFRYNETSPYIFRHLNLTINPGEYVAIVGGSGCGKSTLIRLLLGFENPQSGSIFYDSHSLQHVDLQSLRQHIGTCLQDGRIFQDEVYNNIIITNPMATQEDVWEAARLACFDKDIEELPMGMHTLLGEGGGGLSGGQCQRLLIARALVAKPDILFFDEATSALDNITQRRVTEHLNQLFCTRITIAHRLSTVRNCSRIIVLADGKVAEEGTFDELMEQKGRFYELAKRQIME